MKIVARVERCRRSILPLRDCQANQIRRGNAKAVIGYGQRVCDTQLRLQLCLEFLAHGLRDWRTRLTVDAENLLADGMGPAGEDAGFGGSRPAFDAKNSRDIDMFASEVGDERITGRIDTDSTNGKDTRA